MTLGDCEILQDEHFFYAQVMASSFPFQPSTQIYSPFDKYL